MSVPVAIASLIQSSAAALDALDFHHWLSGFTEYGQYHITTADNQRQGLPLGLMHALNKDQLRDRIASISSVNVYEPHRYRHILSQTWIKGQGLELQYITPFAVYRITPSKPTILFGTGEYQDRVEYSHSGVRFTYRTVVLDNDMIDTLLAIPL